MQGALLFGTDRPSVLKRKQVSLKKSDNAGKEASSTAGNLRVRQTDSDTCPPLLKISSGSIIEHVRNERVSSIAIVRFELFKTTLDPRYQSEAVPFMAFTAGGSVCADGIRWRSFSKAIRRPVGRAFSVRELPVWMF
jgi:hypothetical protein